MLELALRAGILDRHCLIHGGERGVNQAPLVLEVAAGDQRALGVRGQPVRAAAHQLLDLVVAHPVVLLVVEHGQQDVEVGQQRAQPDRRAERQPHVAARPPLVVDRGRHHVVAERLEQAPHERFATTCGHGRQVRGQRDRLRRQFGLRALHRGLEDGHERHRQQRRRHVRPVVDVVGERERPAPAPRQADRVDLEDQRHRAAVLARLGIEHDGPPERQREGLHPLGVLVQQEPEIGRGPVGGGDGEQQPAATLGGRTARCSATRGRKLPGRDSNPNSQIQRLVCCQLHHPATDANAV